MQKKALSFFLVCETKDDYVLTLALAGIRCLAPVYLNTSSERYHDASVLSPLPLNDCGGLEPCPYSGLRWWYLFRQLFPPKFDGGVSPFPYSGIRTLTICLDAGGARKSEWITHVRHLRETGLQCLICLVCDKIGLCQTRKTCRNILSS